jgi:hypothetical protein
MTSETSKLRDRENFNQNEVSKLKSMIAQLEKEKSNLEFQLKNIELNINQNEIFFNNHQQNDSDSKLNEAQFNTMNSSSDLVNGNFGDFLFELILV